MAETAAPTLDPADEAKQTAFIKTFLVVLGVLILFTLFCMMVARILAASAPALENDPILRADVLQRIAPVGSIRTAADADAAGEEVVAVQSGEQIVQGVCAACHLAGVANAPKLDDEAAWASRRELGLDALTASVINGKGAMPARAGTTLSDDELRRAVAAMAGIEIEGDAAGGAEAAPAATEAEAASDTDTNTDAAADTDAAATESAATESAATESAATDTAAESTDTATEETTTAASGAAATATATAAASTAAVAAAGATDAAAEPLEDGAQSFKVGALTPRVKNVVDGICSACHLSGVGGAPKIGDTAVWEERAEKGLAAQVALVISGKGAMPPRGGSDLSDDEVAIAVKYLVSK